MRVCPPTVCSFPGGILPCVNAVKIIYAVKITLVSDFRKSTLEIRSVSPKYVLLELSVLGKEWSLECALLYRQYRVINLICIMFLFSF